MNINIDSYIKSLTDDEDLSQDLWEKHLSDPNSSLEDHLKKIKLENSIEQKIKHNIWQVLCNPPSTNLTKFLSNFTEHEQSIICLLMLGLTSLDIARAKGFSEVRIKQSIASIKYNPIWNNGGVLSHSKQILQNTNDTE